MQRKTRDKSTKIETNITAPILGQHGVIARKAIDQHITFQELSALYRLYGEAVNRTLRSIVQIENLEKYLATKQTISSYLGYKIDFKKLLMEDPVATDELRLTLKMLKRHFYIDIRDISLFTLTQRVSTIKKILQKISDGLLTKNQPLYISNISHKKQQADKVNGYVFSVNGHSIYIDFRGLTEPNLIDLLVTLLHEASHFFAYTDDHGYDGLYYFKKPIKQSIGEVFDKKILYVRRAPNNFNATLAINNADSIAYFIVDLTGFRLYEKNNLPDWWNNDIARKPSAELLSLTFLNSLSAHPLTLNQQESQYFMPDNEMPNNYSYALKQSKGFDLKLMSTVKEPTLQLLNEQEAPILIKHQNTYYFYGLNSHGVGQLIKFNDNVQFESLKNLAFDGQQICISPDEFRDIYYTITVNKAHISKDTKIISRNYFFDFAKNAILVAGITVVASSLMKKT